MRRGNKPEFILNNIGVNLSADYCAEHEWGIKGLKNAFGIPEDIGVYGIKCRQITQTPVKLAWVQFKASAGFVYHSWYWEEPQKLAQNSELWGTGLRAAWSENDFAVVSDKLQDIEKLEELFQALHSRNAVICFGGGGVFENAGLVIAIASKIPALVCEEWYKTDESNHLVRKEFDATGIEKILANADKKYFALSPRRQADGSLKYWLNPYDQKNNNFGWFTLEDLKLWAANKGPIPMKGEKV